MDFQDPPNCMGKIDPYILDWINTVENYFAWNPTIYNQVHYVQGNLGGDALIWWCGDLCGFLLHQVLLNWILTVVLLVIRALPKSGGSFVTVVHRTSFLFGPVIWCLGQCKAMWPLANKVEEMLNLAKRIKASFHHIKQSENEVADCLAKEWVLRQSSFISDDGPFPFLFYCCFIGVWLVLCRCCWVLFSRGFLPFDCFASPSLPPVLLSSFQWTFSIKSKRKDLQLDLHLVNFSY